MKGSCDRDIAYKDYPKIIRGAGLNHLEQTEEPVREITLAALLERCRSEGYRRIEIDEKSDIILSD